MEPSSFYNPAFCHTLVLKKRGIGVIKVSWEIQLRKLVSRRWRKREIEKKGGEMYSSDSYTLFTVTSVYIDLGRATSG